MDTIQACLHSAAEVSIRAALRSSDNNSLVEHLIDQAIKGKQKQHDGRKGLKYDEKNEYHLRNAEVDLRTYCFSTNKASYLGNLLGISRVLLMTEYSLLLQLFM